MASSHAPAAAAAKTILRAETLPTATVARLERRKFGRVCHSTPGQANASRQAHTGNSQPDRAEKGEIHNNPFLNSPVSLCPVPQG